MIAKTKTKSKVQAKASAPVREKPKSVATDKPKPSVEAKSKKPATPTVDNSRTVNKASPPRSSGSNDRRFTSKGIRLPQFAYMKAPGVMHDFQVGDTVEVFCDHEKNRERVRGWISGIVVQVDNKMVAVQFRSNVFLTDGWMVPDRILWYPLTSEAIRPVAGKKIKREKVIPEY